MHLELPLPFLSQGLVSRGFTFLGPGRVWGEDMILPEKHRHHINRTAAIALTYIEVLSLSPEDLYDAAEEFPVAWDRIRRASARILCARLLVLALRRLKDSQGMAKLRWERVHQGFDEAWRGGARKAEGKGPYVDQQALQKAVRQAVAEAVPPAVSAALTELLGPDAVRPRSTRRDGGRLLLDHLSTTLSPHASLRLAPLTASHDPTFPCLPRPRSLRCEARGGAATRPRGRV